MADIRKWALTAGGNSFDPPDGFPEGMKRSKVNDSAREIMRAVRAWYEDPEYVQLMVDGTGELLTVSKLSDTSIRVFGADMTSYFSDNRRVKMTGGAQDPVYAFVSPGGAVYTGGNTDVTVDEFTGHTGVPNGMDAVLLGPKTMGRIGYLNSGALSIYSPVTADSTGIQAEIDAANTAGGGIVLLGEASYAIDSQLTVKPNVVLWGCGELSTELVVDAALAAHPIVAQSASAIIGFTLDCSAHSGAYNGIHVGNGVTDIRFENLRILDAAQDGIHIGTNGVTNCTIRSIYIENPGQHGISIEDALTDASGIFIHSIFVYDPAAAVNEGAGIYWAGMATLSDIHVRMTRATPKIQRGIWSRPMKAGAPIDQSGRLSAVRGFTILGESTADEARGLDVEGRDVVFADGAIDMEAASSSMGIRTGSTEGGQVAEWNRFSNIICERCDTGVYVDSASDSNQFMGITVRGGGTTGLYVAGDRSLFYACVVTGSNTSILTTSLATENRFVACDAIAWSTAKHTIAGSWNVIHRSSASVFHYLDDDVFVTCDGVGTEDSLIIGCTLPTKPDGEMLYRCTIAVSGVISVSAVNDWQRIRVKMGSLYVFQGDYMNIYSPATYPGSDHFDLPKVHNTFYIKPSASETAIDVLVEKGGTNNAQMQYLGGVPTGLSRSMTPNEVAQLYVMGVSELAYGYSYLHIEEVSSIPGAVAH